MYFKSKIVAAAAIVATSLGLTMVAAPAAIAADLPSNCSVHVGVPYKTTSGTTVTGEVSGACTGGDARLKTATSSLDYYTGSSWSLGGTTSYTASVAKTTIDVTGSRTCVTTGTWRTFGMVFDIYGNYAVKQTAAGLSC